MFNALNVMDNQKVLDELKFGIGDGNLHYYLYNWKCPEIEAEKVSMFMHVVAAIYYVSLVCFFSGRSGFAVENLLDV